MDREGVSRRQRARGRRARAWFAGRDARVLQKPGAQEIKLGQAQGRGKVGVRMGGSWRAGCPEEAGPGAEGWGGFGSRRGRGLKGRGRGAGHRLQRGLSSAWCSTYLALPRTGSKRMGRSGEAPAWLKTPANRRKLSFNSEHLSSTVWASFHNSLSLSVYVSCA